MAELKKSTGTRRYQMGRRREQLEAMRERITRAAFELHCAIGPAQTTISAVADLAGVQRHTVYHHFPDLRSLIRACSEHAVLHTGFPEAAPWSAIDDPTIRLRRALGELYGFYRANAQALGNIIRDLPMMTEVGGIEPLLERMTELFAAVAAGWPGDTATQRIRMAAISHAMSYPTWRTLTDHGLSDSEAADLMLRLVSAVGVQLSSQSSQELSSERKQQAFTGVDPSSEIQYGSRPRDLEAYRLFIAQRLEAFSARIVASRAGLSIGTVSNIRRGQGTPRSRNLRALDRALNDLEAEE